MWSFQYKHGDRPLEGFTIQRAAGRGGFGEVYYALSDSGREVALKVVQGYEQIELRGISQCMNLKSPHLVTIFDVKYNAEGRPFVIMEYVSGPSLRQLLDESPAGLGTQKSAFFLREIGKGLTFLHDCGIVHRDLKPGNIFFENGYVKIGDYGLSKAISPTQHSGQTVTVGTVHYMAPEIGAGKYDRSIDIYAMGAVLYEMLTGTVPFIGASPSEILMKHLSADPDLSGVPEPFAAVIRKAMAKDPALRYQSVQEMVEAVFGTEHVRMSVSHFSPDDLSMVAGRVAQKMTVGGGGSSGGIAAGDGIGAGGGSSSVVGSDDIGARIRDRLGVAQQHLADSGERIRQNFQASADRLRDRFGQMGIGSSTPQPQIPPIPDQQPAQINDPLPLGSRQFLGILTAIVVAIASGILAANDRRQGELTPIAVPLFVFTAIVGASIGLIVGWRKIAIPKLQQESHSVRKLAVATVVCGMTLLTSGLFWLILSNHGRYRSGTIIAILAPLAFMNTWNWARSNRKERVALGPAIGAGLIGFILSGIFTGDPMLAIAVLAGTCLVVQVISPWDPVLAANRGWKSKDSPELATPMKVYGNVNATPQQAEAMRAAGAKVYGNLNIQDTGANAPAGVQPLTAAYSANPSGLRMVPTPAPYIWLGSFIILLSIGLMLLIAVGMNDGNGNDDPPFVGLGVAACVSALFCFVRVFQKRFYGWWSYLIRPVLMLLCVNSIVIAAVVLGNMNGLGSDDRLAGTFFIVFPAILFLTLPFLPRTMGPAIKPLAGRNSPHNRGMAFGMACLWFCGVGGIQRFYVGKIGTGILWLMTGGLFGIGQLIDVIMICTGRFTDSEGRVLRFWDRPGEVENWAKEISPPPIPPMPTATEGQDAAQASPVDATPAPAMTAPAPLPRVTSAPATIVRAASGGLVSAITAVLLLATILLSLAIGLDLPQAVAHDLPNPQVAHDIRNALFPDSQMWPALMEKLLYCGAVAVGIIASGMMMAARRHTSLPHILRGLVGIAGLVGAVVVLTAPFNPAHTWGHVSELVTKHQTDQAVDFVISQFRDGQPLKAAAICVGSFLMLSIPPYSRRLRVEKGSV